MAVLCNRFAECFEAKQVAQSRILKMFTAVEHILLLHKTVQFLCAMCSWHVYVIAVQLCAHLDDTCKPKCMLGCIKHVQTCSLIGHYLYCVSPVLM